VRRIALPQAMHRRRNHRLSLARHADRLRGSDSSHPARAAVLALLTGIARDLASHSQRACEPDRMIA
jgi:hypothetical protein